MVISASTRILYSCFFLYFLLLQQQQQRPMNRGAGAVLPTTHARDRLSCWLLKLLNLLCPVLLCFFLSFLSLLSLFTFVLLAGSCPGSVSVTTKSRTNVGNQRGATSPAHVVYTYQKSRRGRRRRGGKMARVSYVIICMVKIFNLDPAAI